MSATQLEKLRALLARVEQRRAEPRLVSLPGGRPLESANTNVGAQSALPEPELAPRAAPTLLEPPLAAPSSMPPPAPGADLPRSTPPAARSEPPPPRPRTSSSIVPPAEAPAAQPRAATEVLPAAPARIPPTPPVPFDSVVRVASSPRLDAPKSFGELLELSLSLRPK